MSTREEENPNERPGKRQKVGSYVIHYVRARTQFIPPSRPDLLIGRLPPPIPSDRSGAALQDEANISDSFLSTPELPTMRIRTTLP